MTNYVIRRLFFALITLLGVTMITFALIYYGPVDPARILAGTRAQGEAVQTLRKTLGLDQPLHIQYWRYMTQLLQGNMGNSWMFHRPVTECLFSRMGYTASLASLIMIAALAVGLPLGTLAAIKNHSLLDRAVQVSGMFLLSMPSFFFGLLLIYFLSFRLGLLPIGGVGTPRHMVLPVLTVALPSSVNYALVIRSNLLDIMHADYVRTARAKGLGARAVVVRHMLKNALLPIVTMAGMEYAGLLTGIVLVESLFNYPGIGWQAAQAASRMDVPMIMGTVLFGSVLIAVANLVVDVLYAVLDPRVRLS
ncbi:MAG: ABC transporter permease [Anaerolineae bacterium]